MVESVMRWTVDSVLTRMRYCAVSCWQKPLFLADLWLSLLIDSSPLCFGVTPTVLSNTPTRRVLDLKTFLDGSPAFWGDNGTFYYCHFIITLAD